MAKLDEISKDELMKLAEYDQPILSGDNLNSLMLLTLFLIKTKEWDGSKSSATFILQNTNKAFVDNLVQAVRMRLSRSRAKLRDRKHDYKQFRLVVTRLEILDDEGTVPPFHNYLIELTRLGNYKQESMSLIEDLI